MGGIVYLYSPLPKLWDSKKSQEIRIHVGDDKDIAFIF